jgi:DMSO/TMAO reductase YedYZ molybdopterin-dependent catalytic subunit
MTRDIVRRFASLGIAALLVAPFTSHVQSPILIVDGEVENKLELSLDEFRMMAHQRIEIDQQGRRAVYEGVPLVEVLRKAGVAIGRAPLQGRSLASVVFVTAADGFQAIFALAELDPASIDQRVLLTDTRDGQPLPANEGPLRLISPADKYPARWLRRVTRLTVAFVNPPK